MATELALTWAQVLSWRMNQSYLKKPSDGPFADVAAHLGGIQAQVMSSAEIGLCIRTAKRAPTDVRKALWQDRSLVKNWTVRGTLHLIDARDLPMFVGVMNARGAYWDKPAWVKYHGINARDMAKLLDGIDTALEGKALTRTELATELSKIPKMKPIAQHVMSSWGGTIKPAAFQGRLCFGPNKGRNVTFVSPRDWIGKWKPMDEDEALGAATIRYIDAYGPSSQDDITRWMGVESKVGRRALNNVKDSLVAVDVEGTKSWLTPAGATSIVKKSAATETVRLLPAFDAYVVGMLKNLEPLVPKPEMKKLISRQAGWITATVVVDGRIVGTWAHKRRARSVDIDLTMLTKVAKPTAIEIDNQVETMRSLLGAVPEEDDVDG